MIYLYRIRINALLRFFMQAIAAFDIESLNLAENIGLLEGLGLTAPIALANIQAASTQVRAQRLQWSCLLCPFVALPGTSCCLKIYFLDCWFV